MLKVLFLVLPQLLAAQQISDPAKIALGPGVCVNFQKVLYVFKDHADNATLLWKFNAPSKIIDHSFADSEGLVYVTTTAPKEHEPLWPMLLALWANNGTEKWRLQLPCSDGSGDCFVDTLSNLRGSAIVHNSHGSNNTGTLLSIRPDGKIQWKFTTGSGQVQVLANSFMGYGSEVLVKGSKEGTLQLLDADYGTVKWTVDFSGGIVHAPTGKNCVVGYDGTVYALAQASEVPWGPQGGYMLVINHNGTIRANISITLGSLCPQGKNPTVAGHFSKKAVPSAVFYVNGLAVGEPHSSPFNCALRAFSQDGTVLWTRATNASKEQPFWLASITSPSDNGDTLTLVSNDPSSRTTTFTSLNGADGAVEWKRNVSSPSMSFVHSMVALGDTVKLVWDDWAAGSYPNNKVYAIQEGKEVWSLTTGEMVAPVVDSEPLTTYIAAFGGSIGPEYLKLFAINQDGTVKWTFSTKPNRALIV